MAKPIFLTSDDVESVCREVRTTLSGLKCYGSIDIKRSFKKDKRVAALYFDPIAWIKMTALVSRFGTEVQWHGKVHRISENEFEVYDILVPPHEVSGATVTSEYKPYIEWMDSLDDDTFEALRFHGHSHVDMSVSPSSVDNKYRLDLVTQLPKPSEDDDVFYIFLIINKSHEWSAEIYDLTNNALYDTDEIIMGCFLEDEDLDSFIEDAKKVAVKKSYANSWKNQYGGSTTPKTSIVKSETAKKTDVKKDTTDTDEFIRQYAERLGLNPDGFYDLDDYDDPRSPFFARGY